VRCIGKDLQRSHAVKEYLSWCTRPGKKSRKRKATSRAAVVCKRCARQWPRCSKLRSLRHIEVRARIRWHPVPWLLSQGASGPTSTRHSSVGQQEFAYLADNSQSRRQLLRCRQIVEVFPSQTWRLVSSKCGSYPAKNQGLQAVRLVRVFHQATRFLSSSSDAAIRSLPQHVLRTRPSRRGQLGILAETADAKEKNCWTGYFRLLSVSASWNEHHRSTTLVARRLLSRFLRFLHLTFFLYLTSKRQGSPDRRVATPIITGIPTAIALFA